MTEPTLEEKEEAQRFVASLLPAYHFRPISDYVALAIKQERERIKKELLEKIQHRKSLHEAAAYSFWKIKAAEDAAIRDEIEKL